jgi:ribosomal protein S18 acetylase RimI-like enzyme
MPTYTTLSIPSPLPEEFLTLLAHKLRIFKLHALLSDPNAFSQSHATEARLPLSSWKARVANPDFRTVVCIVDERGDREGWSRGGGNDEGSSSQEIEGQSMTVQRLAAAEWVGTFTLVGPVARETWLCPLSGQPVPAADGAETRWHLTSLFVLPEHRGCGLAAKLTLAAVRTGSSASMALSEGSGNQGADRNVRAPTRFRLIVHPNNKAVVGLYEKLGFVVGGLYTQREAMVAMGDAAGVPSDAEGEKWDTRFGIGMECLI